MMPRKGSALGDGRIAGAASLEAKARKFMEAAERKARRDKARAALEVAKKALTDEEIKDLLRPTREELLDFKAAVMVGDRNSLAIASGMRVMLEYTLEKPEQKVGVEPVQVVVQTLPPMRAVVQVPESATVMLPAGNGKGEPSA